MDGSHDLDRCAAVTEVVLRTVYDHLARHGVVLEATLLKPNMVLPGTESASTADPDEIAAATIRVLRRSVPAAVPGIVFLSGGLSAEAATANLNALNRQGEQPWQLSFSFGRALQAPVLHAWAGDDARRAEAQRTLQHRAAMNTAARHGSYHPDLEGLLRAT